MSKFAQAVKDVGLSEVARRVGESPQCVNNWIERGAVPIGKVATVEQALDGRVTKRDLRPKDWKSIWPEQAAA